jgi:hypothetical protein
MYASSMIFASTIGNRVNGFTLDPSVGELVRPMLDRHTASPCFSSRSGD